MKRRKKKHLVWNLILVILESIISPRPPVQAGVLDDAKHVFCCLLLCG